MNQRGCFFITLLFLLVVIDIQGWRVLQRKRAWFLWYCDTEILTLFSSLGYSGAQTACTFISRSWQCLSRRQQLRIRAPEIYIHQTNASWAAACTECVPLCAVCVSALAGGTAAHALALSAVPCWRKRVLPRVCARPQANKTQSALFTTGCVTFNVDFSRGSKRHVRLRNALFSLIGAAFKIIA